MSDPSGKHFFHKKDFCILVDFHFGHLLQVRGFLQDQGSGIEFKEGTPSDPKLLLNPSDTRSHKM